MSTSPEILPNGNVESPADIGEIVRTHRKAQRATQAEFAAICGVGVRFISDLENGKPTVELGKVLQVLRGLGLDVAIHPRSWRQYDSARPVAE